MTSILDAKSMDEIRVFFCSDVARLLTDDFNEMLEIGGFDFIERIRNITLIFNSGQLAQVEIHPANEITNNTILHMPVGWSVIPSKGYVRFVRKMQ